MTPAARPTVRTRFAPSPTGRLHLGNVRIAVFNWLFARHHGGVFVLRVEDTDVERNVPGAEGALMDDLRWLGLAWDEGPDVGGPFGPYRQSERAAAHDQALATLLERGRAYRCFCPADEGGEDRRYPGRCRALPAGEAERRSGAGEPHVVRFRTPREDVVQVRDEVRGVISFPAKDLDDFVLRRRDGRATYNFAVVADDAAMRISHVIRGAGHLSNAPKHALLFDALDHPRPCFVHLPNLLAPDGGKLSKRRGAQGAGELRAAGMLPAAIVNYLSLLGWSHPDEREILTLEELVASVSLDRVRAAEMAHDPDKLRWVATQHMARLSLEEVAAGVAPFVDGSRFPLSGDALRAAVGAIRTRLAAFSEVNEHLAAAFPEEGPAWDAVRADLAADAEAVTLLRALAERLRTVDPWAPDEIGREVRAAGAAAGVKGRALFRPVRRALFAAETGPDLAGLTAAVGREEVLRRLGRVPGV
ncbi:MAG: glutamate--tRNA ligase [Longimicrobiales bacterium]|nr:glutamate--tRNA ligase [Longimicrobiales bacterium]